MRSVIAMMLLYSSGLYPLGLFAQVPGFQGKKLSIEGSLIFNTAFFNPNENFKKGYTAFNKRIQAGAEYIIGRNLSVGGSYGIFNSGLEYNHNTYNSSSYYSYNTIDKYKISSNVAGLYLKIFKFRKKGAIAPYGTYGKIGLLSVMIRGEFFERSSSSIPDPPEKLNSSTLILLNYGFGKQFIIKSRFIARVGADFGLNVFTLASSVTASSNTLERLAIKRISNGMVFNLEAGLGILLF
jgi:hypothetical protein